MFFGSVRFGSVRYGSVRFGPVRYGSVRFGPVRYGSVQFGSVRISPYIYNIFPKQAKQSIKITLPQLTN